MFHFDSLLFFRERLDIKIKMIVSEDFNPSSHELIAYVLPEGFYPGTDEIGSGADFFSYGSGRIDIPAAVYDYEPVYLAVGI
jgi:hypothetical protein